jgi:hypothetical protein
MDWNPQPTALPWRDPGPRLELRIPNAAAQTRIVSKARIRLDFRKSVRSVKGIICVDISEFESFMPSHVVSSCARRLHQRKAAGWTDHRVVLGLIALAGMIMARRTHAGARFRIVFVMLARRRHKARF